MSTCANCGAPIAFEGRLTATCDFCDVVNDAPAPKTTRVDVAVIEHVVVETRPENVLRCSLCRKPLVTVRAREIELHGCGSCGGIWLNNADAVKMRRAPDAAYAELARKCAAGARFPGPRFRRPECAVCAGPLELVRTPAASLDLCRKHGTWFDAHELAHVIGDALAKQQPVADEVGALVARRPTDD